MQAFTAETRLPAAIETGELRRDRGLGVNPSTLLL